MLPGGNIIIKEEDFSLIDQYSDNTHEIESDSHRFTVSDSVDDNFTASLTPRNASSGRLYLQVDEHDRVSLVSSSGNQEVFVQQMPGSTMQNSPCDVTLKDPRNGLFGQPDKNLSSSHQQIPENSYSSQESSLTTVNWDLLSDTTTYHSPHRAPPLRPVTPGDQLINKIPPTPPILRAERSLEEERSSERLLLSSPTTLLGHRITAGESRKDLIDFPNFDLDCGTDVDFSFSPGGLDGLEPNDMAYPSSIQSLYPIPRLTPLPRASSTAQTRNLKVESAIATRKRKNALTGPRKARKKGKTEPVHVKIEQALDDFHNDSACTLKHEDPMQATKVDYSQSKYIMDEHTIKTEVSNQGASTTTAEKNVNTAQKFEKKQQKAIEGPAVVKLTRRRITRRLSTRESVKAVAKQPNPIETTTKETITGCVVTKEVEATGRDRKRLRACREKSQSDEGTKTTSEISIPEATMTMDIRPDSIGHLSRSLFRNNAEFESLREVLTGQNRRFLLISNPQVNIMMRIVKCRLNVNHQNFWNMLIPKTEPELESDDQTAKIVVKGTLKGKRVIKCLPVNDDVSRAAQLAKLRVVRPLFGRSFKCSPSCAYRAVSWNAIARHIDENHTSTWRPFRCPVADCVMSVIGLNTATECRRHILNHHDDNKLQCDLCELVGIHANFSRLDSLRRHLRIMHLKQSEVPGTEADPSG